MTLKDSIKLEWSEHRRPNDEYHYTHCIVVTPFGNFVLTWKGWKDQGNEGIGFDETPWGDIVYMGWRTVGEAQAWAREEFAQRIEDCIFAGAV